jgi:CBS-domain-containing membrane protein
MSALFQGKPLQDIRVSDAMAKRLLTCSPNDSVGAAERKMREARIRRLPVVDKEGTLVGMVSLADLAQEAAREQAARRKEITESEVGDTLAAICEPLHRQLAA